VAEAVRVVAPWAVDVASGVERTPGVKDVDRMRLFIDRAKEAR
jgi:phosphoribosylanthranilate isomerase